MRLKVNRKKLRLNHIFHREKYKINFELIVNKIMLGWDSLSHHCRNSKGSGGPQDGNDTNVEIGRPKSCFFERISLS